MKTRAAGFVLLALVCAIDVAMMSHYHPLLPERMAVHFNAKGEANGWSEKGEFVVLYYAIMGAAALLFGGLALSLRKIPSSLFNMPYREYWLAPERKAETCDVLGRYLLWVGNATMVMILGMFYLIMRINIEGESSLRWQFWALMAAYLIFIGGWCAIFYRQFRKKI